VPDWGLEQLLFCDDLEVAFGLLTVSVEESGEAREYANRSSVQPMKRQMKKAITDYGA